MKKILIILISGLILVTGCEKKQEIINLKNNVATFEKITGEKVHFKSKKMPIKNKIISKNVKNNVQKVSKNVKKKKQLAQNKVDVKKRALIKKQQEKKRQQKQQQQNIVKNLSYNKSELQSYAHSLVISYGWSEYDFECLVNLWNRESGWSPNAVNKSSGACGIPQSLPCNKMASYGSDYRTNGKTQIRWGLDYIKNRYGSPANAWAHSQQKGWY